MDNTAIDKQNLIAFCLWTIMRSQMYITVQYVPSDHLSLTQGPTGGCFSIQFCHEMHSVINNPITSISVFSPEWVSLCWTTGLSGTPLRRSRMSGRRSCSWWVLAWNSLRKPMVEGPLSLWLCFGVAGFAAGSKERTCGNGLV